MMIQDGQPVWVEREVDASLQSATASAVGAASALEMAYRAQIAGPSALDAAQGLQGFFPSGSAVDSVTVEDGHGTVRLTLPESYLQEMTDVDVELSVYQSIAIGEATPGLQSLSVLARAPGDDEYRSLNDFLPTPVLNEKPAPEAPEAALTPVGTSGQGQPVHGGQPQPQGALSGASIFINPGHGWYYNSDVLGRWATQRGNTNNIIEDLSNGEAVLQFLVPYLWNAGARVYTCRERDLQTNEVIVENGGSGHSSTGSWSTVALADAHGGDLDRATTVTGTPTATSTFTPTIPEDGHYAVYVWYRTAGTGTTTSDARITINHTGGSTVWTQNQNRDGYTWKYVGTYYFEAGASASTGSVVIDNQGSTAGQYVVADAVRFGGGMGTLMDPDGGGISGEPRWEESGRYYRIFMGDDDTWAGTVGSMPQYADWECEDSWEGGANNNAIYVAWHTNAAANPDTGTGTSSFAFSSAGWDGAFNGVAGGLELRNAIHTELINDIRAGWDAGWSDRGLHTANFGEVNPSNNNDMPAALTEIAFHDTAVDAEDLRDPNFRRLAARAVYQGIVKFYHDYYYTSQGNVEFNDDTLLPEPPTNLRVLNTGGGNVSLAWNAPPSNAGDDLLGDLATGYRIYRSSNGKGFDNGSAVAGTSTTVSGLTAGEVVYFRVTATNSGGESFPTETLAARVHSSGTPTILIVNGFDRIDEFANIVEDDPYSTADLHRGYLWLMNTYDYIIAHAEAIDAHGIDFDSCSNEAVIANQVNLTNYDTVVWICGEEANVDDTLNATEQTRLTTFLTGGGRLFISGSEIAWELDSLNQGRSFYENTLHANYVSDDAGVYGADGSAGSIFDGVSLTFDDGSSIYNVDWPDEIAANAGSALALEYSGVGASTAIDNFESIGGWWDPNTSGSTNADAACTFTIVGSPTHQGSGSGDLYYVWGTGNRIREYNSTQPQFPAASNFSIWVYGDSSGNQIRISLRDPVDDDIMANALTTINFTGWQELVWNDIANNLGTFWWSPGDGTLTGSNVILDSVELFYNSGSASGHIYVDEATYTLTGGGGGGAAIQWTDGTPDGSRIVMLGFPFETITNVTVRNQMMSDALTFFGTPVPVELSVFRVD